jgi:uncharacterized protein (TIGR01777 family)
LPEIVKSPVLANGVEMKVLIAGGSGFLGRVLTVSFLGDDHQVYILTRDPRSTLPSETKAITWDGKTTDGWGELVNDIDVVIHLAGKTLASWPWTTKMKRTFLESRLQPGLALALAIEKATHRPRVFIQQSGINHYGLRGTIADESTPPADDFLAQLTVRWENATESVEALGVRRVVTRSAVVLAKKAGLFPLMALPVKLFVGGPLGSGKQAMPWIHIQDWVGAVRYLTDLDNANGVYNLISPVPTSNAEFTRTLAKVLHRPYSFPTPAFLLRLLLGEMSILLLEGRFSQPQRLIESGYRFQFPGPYEAFTNLYG